MGNFILCLRQCPQQNSIKCSTLTENFSLLLSSTYFEVSNVGYLFENLFQKGHFLIGLYCSHLGQIDSDLRMFLWFICLSISRLEIDHQALRESFICVEVQVHNAAIKQTVSLVECCYILWSVFAVV